jgi:TRAP-type C4-dicarboxylate transport system permease small subunit
MTSIIDYLPQNLRSWCRRYRRRLIVLAVLLGIYLGVQLVDWVLDRFVLDSPLFQSGPLKMTRRHFQQPAKSLFTWSNFNRFLDNVTRDKPGILGQKWVYVILIALYLYLSVLVFLRLTEPGEDDESKTNEKTETHS